MRAYVWGMGPVGRPTRPVAPGVGSFEKRELGVVQLEGDKEVVGRLSSSFLELRGAVCSKGNSEEPELLQSLDWEGRFLFSAGKWGRLLSGVAHLGGGGKSFSF